MAAAMLDEVDVQLRAIISNLYMLMVQAHDYQGQGSQRAMSDEIRLLVQNLTDISRTAKRLPTHIPEEIIKYVEASRNPDIYTREFVELVMRYNQQHKGRSEAFGQFRDILGQRMMAGIPEIRGEVKQVVEATGGHVE